MGRPDGKGHEKTRSRDRRAVLLEIDKSGGETLARQKTTWYCVATGVVVVEINLYLESPCSVLLKLNTKYYARLSPVSLMTD